MVNFTITWSPIFLLACYNQAENPILDQVLFIQRRSPYLSLGNPPYLGALFLIGINFICADKGAAYFGWFARFLWSVILMNLVSLMMNWFSCYIWLPTPRYGTIFYEFQCESLAIHELIYTDYLSRFTEFVLCIHTKYVFINMFCFFVTYQDHHVGHRLQ